MRVFALMLALSACQDLRDFEGNWRGPVSGDPQLASGAPVQTLSLSLTQVDHTQITGVMNGLPLSTIKHAAADAVADVAVGRDALRSYFAYNGGAWAIVSLFPDQRIEVRLIAGDTLYFYDLRRL
jgi:hypothetical protein